MDTDEFYEEISAEDHLKFWYQFENYFILDRFKHLKPEDEWDAKDVTYKMWITPGFLDRGLRFQPKQDLRLLEISCGPNIYNMAYAAQKEQISFINSTEFAKINIDYVTQVVNDFKSTNFDWTGYAEKALGNKIDADSFFATLKAKFGGCHFLDLKKPSCDVIGGNYDVIICELTLSDLAQTLDEFSVMLKFINSLMKVGGLFIFMDHIDESWWRLSETKPVVKCLPVSYEWLKNELQVVGFDIHEVSVLPKPIEDPLENIHSSKGLMTFRTTKIKDS